MGDTKRRGRGKDLVAQLMFLPSLLVLLGFTFYPIVWALVSSFKTVSLGGLARAQAWQIPGAFVGLRNYATVLSSPLFLKALGNTALYALYAVPATIGLALLLAVLLRRKMGGTSFFRTVFFLPYVVSLVSASLIFLTIFDGQAGIANGLLRLVGASPVYWMADSFWAMVVVALLGVWLKTGYYMLFFLAGLQGIGDEYYEAARIDGAGAFQQFTRITVPALRPIILVVLVLLLRDVLIVFQEIYVMTGGGPANSTTTVAFLIYREAFSNLRIGTSSAMSFVLAAIAVSIAWLQARALKEDES